MKQKWIVLRPYLIALAVDFYFLPLLIRNTGAGMLLTLSVIPLCAFNTGVVWGIRNGLGILLPAAALVLFAPTIFLYYNASAWVYAPAYGAVVLLGVGVGGIFHQKR